MKPLTVLAIDDERVIGDACRMVLGDNGHHVTHCFTGEEGLQAIQQGTYDLILLDMKLPDIDGSRILKWLRNKSKQTKVIVMTGYCTMSNALEAMKLGAVDYLSKPFTEDDLLAAIREQFAGAGFIGDGHVRGRICNQGLKHPTSKAGDQLNE